MPELRIQIPDDLDARIEAAMPEYLDRKGFLCLLIDQALDSPVTLGVQSAAGTPSNSKAVASKRRIHTYIEDIGPFLDERLFSQKELLQTWWDTRRQVHGRKVPGTEQAWKASQNALLAIEKAHGAAVLKSTIEAAVAAGWRGIRESYAALPAKGHAPAQPEHKHPAAREFRNGRFVDEDGPTTNPALEGLF